MSKAFEPGWRRPWKRRGLAFLAAGWLALGCSLLQSGVTGPAPNIHPQFTRWPTISATTKLPLGMEGGWDAFYSWGCGSFSEAGWILHPDATFFSPEADGGGIWIVQGSEFRLTFGYNPNTTCMGTVNPNRDSMEGSMANDSGGTGCWHAVKTQPMPSITASRTLTPPAGPTNRREH